MSKKQKCPYCGEVYTKRGMHLHIKAKHKGEKPKGRPKGSKNNDFVRAVQVPATCPKCGSTDLTVKPGSHKKEIEKTVQKDGNVYNRIVWRLNVCGNCEQHVRVRTYENT